MTLERLRIRFRVLMRVSVCKSAVTNASDMHRRLGACSLISFVVELREAFVLAIADRRTISEGEIKKTKNQWR